MTSIINEIGETLKSRRQEMNISLKEAENATSIRMVFLQAIEEGDMKKLISPVYAQGFIKQYSAYLGVDVDHYIRENPQLFNRGESQDFSYGIGTIEMRGHPGGGVKWFPNALWIVGFTLVLIVAWYFARFLEVI